MEYYDENNKVRPELLDRDAYEQAKKFIRRYYNNKKQKEEVDQKRTLTSSQLRRFFNEFRQLEKKVNINGFDKVKPLIKMTKSKAAYASNPRKPKIPEAFKDFLIENVDKINTETDFKTFMLYFEAVVGFYYGLPGVPN